MSNAIQAKGSEMEKAILRYIEATDAGVTLSEWELEAILGTDEWTVEEAIEVQQMVDQVRQDDPRKEG